MNEWTDATYFPDRSAKIFYRPPLVPGAHITFAPIASLSSANATATISSTSAHLEPTSTIQKLRENIVGRDVEIGSIGILHPTVLKAYELDFPCSAVEFDVEPFL